jgi:hypothetical protein
MSQSPQQTSEGASRWQRWVVGCVMALVALVIIGSLLLHLLAGRLTYAPSIGCLNNLQRIHSAACFWADEHQTNRLPSEFFLLTNYLRHPNELRCQTDYQLPKISTWAEFTRSNTSYVINTMGIFMESTNEYVVCPLHHYSVTGNGRVSHKFKWIDGTVVPRNP